MGAATARYDGHADWYDGWARTDAGGFMAHAQAALAELLRSVGWQERTPFTGQAVRHRVGSAPCAPP
jgi:hypothetical protein